jgi:hypothetical protein
MVLSAAGVLASFCLSFASVTANPEIQKSAFRFLFPGIFVVCLPTILFVNWLTRDFKQRDLWKAALRGCPTWMNTPRRTLLKATVGVRSDSNVPRHTSPHEGWSNATQKDVE